MRETWRVRGRRLELLGIDDEQIDEILASEKGRTRISIIRSPITGHVIKKYIREGQYVEQGMPLYDIADLSTVWIQAQVYEDDLEFLPADQSHKQIGERRRPSAGGRHHPGICRRAVLRHAGVCLSPRRSKPRAPSRSASS